MLYQIDLDILYFFNHTIAGGAMDAVVQVLTKVKFWMPVYIIAGIALIWLRKQQGVIAVLFAGITVAACDSLTHYILKPMFGRLRPCTEIPGGHIVSWIRLPVGPSWDPSFPSSHAVNNFAIATFFVFAFPNSKVVRWLYLAATLIALGRVYEGVHYPSDILGGAIIGSILGYLFAWLYRYSYRTFESARARK